MLFEYKKGRPVNNFNCQPLVKKDIQVKNDHSDIRVIVAMEGELLTDEIHRSPGKSDMIITDIDNDIFKIVVKDRYKNSPPAIGFITGFGLKTGAFASSIAHDSHNIIAVGTNDSDIVKAMNEIINLKGGLPFPEKES